MTMSDETYYTVLNVKETASTVEIKTAYRDLIKQVHPDTIANLAPYLRKIAEDKAKEITEAYGVLSNPSKRRDYDRQLAAYRHQTTPSPQATPTPQSPPTPQQPSQCPICGRSDGGHFAACVNSRTSQSSTSSGPAATTPKPAATPKVIKRLGYNWGPLLDWAGEHPIMVVVLFIAAVFGFAALFSDTNTPQSANPTPVTNSAKAASTGPYSAYPCDFRDKVSPIDGKPCSERQTQSVPAPQGAFGLSDLDEKKPDIFDEVAAKPTVSVSGTYIGTVHNQTANLSSTFTVVIHQTKAGLFEGCAEVKPPLYGSGVLRGSIRGSHVNFVVADITFQGDASKTGITGSYVVSRQEGNQLGDFRLSKQTGTKASYGCADGAVLEFEISDSPTPTTKPVAKTPTARFAVVTGRDGATVYKRCAFLPLENYGRCNYGPEEVAELKRGDRVRILSPLTRAQNGDDIYKVKTQQGWEGWARAEDITLEPQ
jgi:hypothetical protein